MPFDKTTTSPDVQLLLDMRDYIEKRGFCTTVRDDRGSVCFYGASIDVALDSGHGYDLVWNSINARARYELGDDVESWLKRAGITTTQVALEVIDDAIARVSLKQAS